MSEAEIRPRRSGAAAPDLLVSSYSSGMPASPEGGGEGRRKLGKPAPPLKWGAAETAETVVLASDTGSSVADYRGERKEKRERREKREKNRRHRVFT